MQQCKEKFKEGKQHWKLAKSECSYLYWIVNKIIEKSGFSGSGSAMKQANAQAIAPARGSHGLKSGKISQLQTCSWSSNPAENVPKFSSHLFVCLLLGPSYSLCSQHSQCLSEHSHCLQTLVQHNSSPGLRRVNGILLSDCRMASIVGDTKEKVFLTEATCG